MAMKPKTEEINGRTYALLDDEGRVLYDNDGQEFAFDAEQTYGKIQSLQSEAKQHRERAETAENQLKEFGDADPATVRDALDKAKKIDQKELVDAGKVDEVRNEVAQSYQAKIDELNETLEKQNQQFAQEKLNSAFSSSQFIQENLAVPPDMAKATFGQNFEVSDGQLVPKDQNGNVIYSRKNPGEMAGFDEAMEQIVESYPYKEKVMKASNHQGTGGEGGEGGQAQKRVTRQQFENMNPQQQQEVAQGVKDGTAAITD